MTVARRRVEKRRIKKSAGFISAGLTVATALALLFTTACRVDPDGFHDRVFRCDTAAPDPLCGTDRQGNDMQCFAARQLGGADFCTERCGEQPMSLPSEGAVCVQGQAKLKACDPNADSGAHPLGPCDRREFGCLRTDVLTDEGVCVTMSPCVGDDDCHDPVRSTCAATFLKELYANSGDELHADHLYCLQKGCKKNSSSCSPGETCLRDVIPAGANPPDICVPNCDSHGQCPPNHFCFQKISGPANPAVCIPGLMGFVCDSDIDCLVGSCRSDNDPSPEEGLKLCTTSCARDDQCSKFNSAQGIFLCVNDHCASPNAYRGASCDTNADCQRDKGTSCVRFSPDDVQGTCLSPCTDGRCAPRGGIGRACLPLLQEDGTQGGYCFPGYYGAPCFDDSACVRTLTCRGADPAATPPVAGFCSTLCATDSDCAKNPFVDKDTYCGAQVEHLPPFCLPLQKDGEACLDRKQCASKGCNQGKCGKGAAQ